MSFKKLMMAVAAVSMTAAPVLAANPAAPLSVSSAARTSAKAGKSQFEGNGWIIAAVAAVAVVVAIVVISDDDSNSP